MIAANLGLYHLILVATSIIDRAGIPVSYLSGLVLLKSESHSPFLFTVLCVIAGCVGDLFMYLAGSCFFERKQVNSPIYRSTFNYKVHRFAEVFEKQPFMWILFSRAFQLINQFILLGVGVNKYSPLKTFVAVVIGNILWFGGFFLIYYFYDTTLTTQSTPVNIATGAAGLLIMYLLLKRLGKRFEKKG